MCHSNPSKVLELWSALSVTWCMKYVGSAELDSNTPGILVPWCTTAQCSYLRTSLYETKNACLASQLKTLMQSADALEYKDQVEGLLSMPLIKLLLLLFTSLIAFLMILAAV